MIIIGVDYHPEFQQMASVDTEIGEFEERRLQHREEAEQFYRELAQRQVEVRIGMEASGQARWFERLLSELHRELWIGEASEIERKHARKQKADRKDVERTSLVRAHVCASDRVRPTWNLMMCASSGNCVFHISRGC